MTRLWFQSALLAQGWASRVAMQFDQGRIVSLRSGVDPEPADDRYGLALPGLPNVHSHAFQRAAAGRTGQAGDGRDSFWTWRSEIYRLAQALSPEAVQAIAALAYAEMLECGFTQVGEFHYLHHAPGGQPYDDPAEMAGRCLAAADDVGIELTLLPVFYARADVAGAPPGPEQARFACTLDQYAALVDAFGVKLARVEGARLGVAPHSLRAVSPEQLAVLERLRPADPIHIHVAEQQNEVEQCLQTLGARPVDWLLDHAEVDERWCLVHATHVTAEELARVARSRATVGLCPITEADLGDGIFPAAGYLHQGGRFGVGSDSNLFIDVAAELRLLEYGQRLTRGERNVLAPKRAHVGRALFDGALDGARVLGRPAREGLSEGAPATLISLALDRVEFEGCSGDALLDAWIFASRRPAVDSVWSRGRRVVKDGRHIARDRVEVRYRKAIAGLG